METMENFNLIKEFAKGIDFSVDGALPYGDYRNSWDWLMPVVDRINSFTFEPNGDDFVFNFIIHPARCVVLLNTSKEEPIDIVANEHGSTTIEMVYETVVAFIKWWNKHIDYDLFVGCEDCEIGEEQGPDDPCHHIDQFDFIQYDEDVLDRTGNCLPRFKCQNCGKEVHGEFVAFILTFEKGSDEGERGTEFTFS